MGLRCSACGFRSTERALFRRGRGLVLPFRRTLCFACKTPERWPKTAIAVVAWSGIALALTACAQAGADFDDQVYTWLVLAIFSVSAPFTVFVHEVGHALAAVLVGRRVYLVSIGRGAPFASWCFGDLQIVLARDLGRGFVQAYPERQESRRRTAIFVAGGIIANLTAVGGAVGLLALISFSTDSWGPTAKCLASALVGFALSNLLSAVLAIIPRHMKWGDGRLASDGRRLVDLWRNPRADFDYAPWHVSFSGIRLMRSGRWGDAQAHYAAAIARAPDQPGFLGCLVHVIAREHGPRAAMACYHERQDAFEAAGRTPSPQYAYAAGNVAWQALRTGDASWLDLADELSERAVSMDASSGPLKATRGAALMARGEHEAGAAMLTAALPDIEDALDKAEFCAFLARQTGERGEDALAAAFERAEAHLLARAKRQAAH